VVCCCSGLVQVGSQASHSCLALSALLRLVPVSCSHQSRSACKAILHGLSFTAAMPGMSGLSKTEHLTHDTSTRILTHLWPFADKSCIGEQQVLHQLVKSRQPTLLLMLQPWCTDRSGKVAVSL
jgi:hypothetical protein